MSTSSEANPSTDSRHKSDDVPAGTATVDAIADEGEQTTSPADSGSSVDEDLHSWPVQPPARRRSTQKDSSASERPTEARTVQAGPDLEIVPDQDTALQQDTAPQQEGAAQEEVAAAQEGAAGKDHAKDRETAPDRETESGRDHAPGQRDAPSREPAQGSEVTQGRDAVRRREHASELEAEAEAGSHERAVGDGVAGGPGFGSMVSTALAFLVGRIDRAEAARHIVEHRRPLLWIWRRVVGMSFAYILISVTWFLIKLPSTLVADATIPSQIQVAAAFHELRIDGIAGATLGAHAGSSLFRFATGLGIGAALGIALGIITGSAPLVRTIVDPVTSFFRLVPGLAAGPLLLVWFGLGEAGLISVVAFSVLWTTMASASDGRTATVRRGAVLTGGSDAVAVDAVFDAVRAAVVVAWTTMLAIETVAASTGLGAMIWFAQGRSDLVVAGILVVGLIGFAIDSALRLTHYVITYDAAPPAGTQSKVDTTAEGDGIRAVR